jgi:hypothetical protein
MSLIVAVRARGESDEELGESVSDSRAGTTIVPGLSSETLGEHFPDEPVTVHTVTAWAPAAGTMYAAQRAA